MSAIRFCRQAYDCAASHFAATVDGRATMPLRFQADDASYSRLHSVNMASSGRRKKMPYFFCPSSVVDSASRRRRNMVKFSCRLNISRSRCSQHYTRLHGTDTLHSAFPLHISPDCFTSAAGIHRQRISCFGHVLSAEAPVLDTAQPQQPFYD